MCVNGRLNWKCEFQVRKFAGDVDDVDERGKKGAGGDGDDDDGG